MNPILEDPLQLLGQVDPDGGGLHHHLLLFPSIRIRAGVLHSHSMQKGVSKLYRTGSTYVSQVSQVVCPIEACSIESLSFWKPVPKG